MGDAVERKTLLCVDDEATGLFVRKMILESQGYQVFTAENGPDALTLFVRETIDLVILDYAMPGQHGGILAGKMKALNSSVPIVMLSAYVDLPGEVLALVDESVTKGEPPGVLLAAIAALLLKKPAAHARSVA
jgi:DNA-binding response OmpR family regulator